MNLKLDENLSRHLKSGVAALGHEVQTAEEEGLLSQPDHVVFTACKREGRLRLTLDLDFSDIRKYPPGTHPGILLFRPKNNGIQAVGEFVMAFLSRQDLAEMAGCLVVVDPDRIRVRRPLESS